MSNFKELPSIRSFYALIAEALKNEDVQFVYENENVENPEWQTGIVMLGLNTHVVNEISNELAIAPLTARQTRLGMQDGGQYNIEKCNDNVTIQIIGTNDIVYGLLSKIKGMLNGFLSDRVFRKNGVLMFSMPEQSDFIIETNTGGATVRGLQLSYNVIYSLVNKIVDDVAVEFYEEIIIDKQEIEE